MPGSDLYYLTKLGRLELMGIPELHYEPLYCNSDMSRLLPGLYRHTSREQVEKTVPSPNYASLIDWDIVDFDTAVHHTHLRRSVGGWPGQPQPLCPLQRADGDQRYL